MSIDPTLAGALTGIVSAVLTFLGVRYSASSSKKASELGSSAEYQKGLVLRIEKLEAGVEELRAQLDKSQNISRFSFSYIERLLMFILDHGPYNKEIPPIPTQLAEYVAITLSNNRPPDSGR